MEKWFSSKSKLSNGELIALGLAFFFAGRMLAAPDTEAQARAALFAAGAAAGATAGAADPQEVAQLQPAQGQEVAPGVTYEPPQFGGYPPYPYGGDFFGR